MTVSCCLTVGTFANSGKRNIVFSARKGKYRIGIKSIRNGYDDAISEPENSEPPYGREAFTAGINAIANRYWPRALFACSFANRNTYPEAVMH
jgi:hypothetical protein